MKSVVSSVVKNFKSYVYLNVFDIRKNFISFGIGGKFFARVRKEDNK